MQSWTFCKEVFVSRQGLQTAVNKYLSTKILVPIPPEYMCTILRITSKLHVPIPWLDFKIFQTIYTYFRQIHTYFRQIYTYFRQIYTYFRQIYTYFRQIQEY